MLRSEIQKKEKPSYSCKFAIEKSFRSSIFISTSVSIMINSWYTYIYILPPIWLPHYWNTGRCIEPPAKSLRVLASSCCVDNQFFFPKNEAREGYRLRRRTKMVSSFFLLIDPFRFSFQFQFIETSVILELGDNLLRNELRRGIDPRTDSWFKLLDSKGCGYGSRLWLLEERCSFSWSDFIRVC